MANGSSIPVKDWITVPAVITLLVTLLRLIGELNDWSPTLFGKEAGGGGALIGIVWLVPIFGVYFGWKLAGSGHFPADSKRALGWLFLILGLFVVESVQTEAIQHVSETGKILMVAIYSIAAVCFSFKAWPEMARVLFAYALAARVPVVVVMFIAIFANWGTHYDVVPSDSFPDYAPFVKWILIGVVPQMTAWIAFTLLLGGIFGTVTAALAKQK